MKTGTDTQIKVILGAAVVLLLTYTAQLLLLETSLAYWLMLVVPLLLLLPGIRRSSTRSLQWLGFLVLFYFTAGVLQLFSGNEIYQWIGALALSCSVLMFFMVIIRIRSLRKLRTNEE